MQPIIHFHRLRPTSSWSSASLSSWSSLLAEPMQKQWGVDILFPDKCHNVGHRLRESSYRWPSLIRATLTLVPVTPPRSRSTHRYGWRALSGHWLLVLDSGLFIHFPSLSPRSTPNHKKSRATLAAFLKTRHKKDTKKDSPFNLYTVQHPPTQCVLIQKKNSGKVLLCRVSEFL